MKALGADLSLTGTGISVLEDGKVKEQASIKSSKTGNKASDEIKRLRGIVTEIMEYVDTWKPDIVVIEGIAFMSRNTTALAQLAGLNYMVRSELVERDIPFLIVAPTTLKKYVTGSGNASKDVMMLMTFKEFGVTILDNNENDAYGLAHIGLSVLQPPKKLKQHMKEVVKLVKTQLE